MLNIKTKLRRAFTIVELVVVIAVIAALAAILIPTFVNVVNNANQASDTSLVNYINTTLATEEAKGNVPDKVDEIYNVTGALNIVADNGVDVTKLDTTANNADFVYNATDNTFLYYTDDFTTLYNGEEPGDDDVLILVASSFDASRVTTAANAGLEVENYCVYCTSGTVTIEGSSEITVWLYGTNNTTFTVDLPNGIVMDYCSEGTVSVTNIAYESYHIYGTYKELSFKYGHLVLESGAKIVKLSILNDNAEEAKTKLTYSADVTIESYYAVSGFTEIYSEDDSEKTVSVDDFVADLGIEITGAVVGSDSTEEQTVSVLGLGTAANPYLATEENIETILAISADTLYISLAEDFTATITLSGNVVLNLNGHTVSASSKSIVVNSGANVTINGSGTITSSGQSYYAVYNSGTLTLNNVAISGAGYGVYSSVTTAAIIINGGSVSSTSNYSIYAKGSKTSIEINNAEIETTGSSKNAIYKDSGTLTINGEETYIYSKTGAAINSTTSYSTTKTTININAGTIKSDNKYAIYVVKGTTLNITGGTVESAGGTSACYGIWLAQTTSASYASELNISGGNIVSNASYGIYVKGATAKYTKVNVSGTASITSNATDNSYCVGILNYNGIVNISGGTITAENGTGIYNNSSADNELNISGGTISGYRGIENLYTMTMTGGTVIGEEIGIYIAEGTAGKTTTISGSSVVKAESESNEIWSYGIYINSGMALSVSDTVTVSAANAAGAAAGIFCVGNGDSDSPTIVTISGGTISGDTYGITGNGSASYSKVTILGGSINGGMIGYYHPEMGTLDITGGSIIGKYAGLQICAGTVTISGGTFTATATSAEISASGFDAANKTGDGVIADGAAVSIINRSGYGTYSSTGSSITSVKITGGTFVSAEGIESIQTYSFDSTNRATEWTDKDTYVTIKES